MSATGQVAATASRAHAPAHRAAPAGLILADKSACRAWPAEPHTRSAAAATAQTTAPARARATFANLELIA